MKKPFFVFNPNDFFEFLRRTVSLLSSSVMITLVMALGIFFAKVIVKIGILYYVILLTNAMFLFFVLIAILHDLNKDGIGFNINYIGKLIVFIVAIFIAIGILYVAFYRAADLFVLIVKHGI